MHTPSAPTPQVQQPASATDPRFSTSGILNAQTKEKNRQGLLSTYGGRTGEVLNVNKFADKKIEERNPSAVGVLEKAARLYQNAKNSAGDVNRAGEYNANVDALNKLYASYGDKSNLEKANVKTETKTWTTRSWYGPGTGHTHYHKQTTSDITNKDAINNTLSKLGSSGETFNDLEKQVKKNKQPTK